MVRILENVVHSFFFLSFGIFSRYSAVAKKLDKQKREIWKRSRFGKCLRIKTENCLKVRIKVIREEERTLEILVSYLGLLKDYKNHFKGI